MDMSSSKKHEKANTGTFWKKSSISAIPGRPNLSQSGNVGGSVSVGIRPSGTPHSVTQSTVNSKKTQLSFRDFDASVSDAWSNQDPAPLNDDAMVAAIAAASTLQLPVIPALAVATGQPRPATSPLSSVFKATASPSQSYSSSASNGYDRNNPSTTAVVSPSVRSVVLAESPISPKRDNPAHPSSSTNTSRGCSSPGNGGQDGSFCDISVAKSDKIAKILSNPNIDLESLRSLSWAGLPRQARSKAWKVLCGYVPAISGRQEEIIQRKQEEYKQYIVQYFQTKDQDIHQETYRQIHIDIPRMSPVIGLFQQRCVQEIFERILYIWAIRHPASGYVQGINDLVTPFFLVFLQDYLPPETEISEIDVEKSLSPEEITSMEADSFWCLTKVLDGIQDNYTFAQPGIQLKVKQLEELVSRIDKELHNHLINQEVIYLQFAFRWMNNILMRELPIKATIRLWDTYLSELEGFSHFHLYVCAAFLTQWKSELLKKTDFHTLLMFLQNLPTAKWGDKEINLLVAEAFRLSYLFADAPKHFSSASTTTTGQNN